MKSSFAYVLDIISKNSLFRSRFSPLQQVFLHFKTLNSTMGTEFHYSLGYYYSLEGEMSSDTMPLDEEVLEFDGPFRRLTRVSYVFAELNNYECLHRDLYSLRKRLFSEGFPIVEDDELNVSYQCNPLTIEHYCGRIARYITDYLHSCQQNVLFCLVFEVVICPSDMEPIDALESIILAESAATVPFRVLPAVQEAINGLETTKIDDDSNPNINKDCVICLEELSRDEEHTSIVTAQATHGFVLLPK